MCMQLYSLYTQSLYKASTISILTLTCEIVHQMVAVTASSDRSVCLIETSEAPAELKCYHFCKLT